jgi:hypothetical protein
MPTRNVQIRDVDIRRSLHAEVRRRHESEPGTLILDELALCQGEARVDVAVVNGRLHGYEIKSACDTLERLPKQKDVYGRALDFVTVVTTANHAKAVRACVPPWWGIWAASATPFGTVSLKQTRAPRQNPEVDALALAQLLWRDEALAHLRRMGLARGLERKPRATLWAKLVCVLPVPELAVVVRDCLKGRDRWRDPSPQASGGDSFRPSAK